MVGHVKKIKSLLDRDFAAGWKNHVQRINYRQTVHRECCQVFCHWIVELPCLNWVMKNHRVGKRHIEELMGDDFGCLSLSRQIAVLFCLVLWVTSYCSIVSWIDQTSDFFRFQCPFAVVCYSGAVLWFCVMMRPFLFYLCQYLLPCRWQLVYYKKQINAFDFASLQLEIMMIFAVCASICVNYSSI